jgi:hypothetical protein
MPKYTALEEELAIELHDKFLDKESWKAILGDEKPTWEQEAEHNRDDFRAQARVALNFLFQKGFICQIE